MIVSESYNDVLEVLRSNNVVCIPTDTVYAISSRAVSDDAVSKIYDIKKREIGKPLPIFVASFEMAAKYVEFTDQEAGLAEKFWPGPLTIILKKRQCISLSDRISMSNDIGVRVPNNQMILDLCRDLNEPIVATSANISNYPPSTDYRELIDVFQNYAGLIYKSDPNDVTQPSTVVKLQGRGVEILREGAIAKQDIMNHMFK